MLVVKACASSKASNPIDFMADVLCQQREPVFPTLGTCPANVLPLTCGTRASTISTAREGRARARPGAVRCSGLLDATPFEFHVASRIRISCVLPQQQVPVFLIEVEVRRAVWRFRSQN